MYIERIVSIILFVNVSMALYYLLGDKNVYILIFSWFLLATICHFINLYFRNKRLDIEELGLLVDHLYRSQSQIVFDLKRKKAVYFEKFDGKYIFKGTFKFGEDNMIEVNLLDDKEIMKIPYENEDFIIEFFVRFIIPNRNSYGCIARVEFLEEVSKLRE